MMMMMPFFFLNCLGFDSLFCEWEEIKICKRGELSSVTNIFLLNYHLKKKKTIIILLGDYCLGDFSIYFLNCHNQLQVKLISWWHIFKDPNRALVNLKEWIISVYANEVWCFLITWSHTISIKKSSCSGETSIDIRRSQQILDPIRPVIIKWQYSWIG